MPQPVKLSDVLIDAAREAAPLAHRSLAAQVEHWAALGRAIEGNLTLQQSATLKLRVQEPRPANYSPQHKAQALADAIESALAPAFGEQVRAELLRSPLPVYGRHPAYPGYLVRREPDGSLTPGHLVNREFQPVDLTRT